MRRMSAKLRAHTTVVEAKAGLERERSNEKARDEYRRANPIIAASLERQTQRREARAAARRVRQGEPRQFDHALAAPVPQYPDPSEHLSIEEFGMTQTWSKLMEDNEPAELTEIDQLIRIAKSGSKQRRTESRRVTQDDESEDGGGYGGPSR